MKLTCTRDNLHQGLSIVSHLTGKNVNLPILQNVLIKAESGTIRFTTTNLEMAVSCLVRGKLEETGETTVPSKLFYDYVSLLPNDAIVIEGNADYVRVSCGSQKTKMNALAATEFPLVPRVQGTKTYKIPANDFREALSQVVFAVATNESRPELTGVLMRFTVGNGEGRLTLAATDSYRLAERTIPLVSQIEEENSVIIPAKTLLEVNRILSVFRDDVESPPSIELSVSDSQAAFTYGPVELISRMIEGNYPDYGQIIPKDFDTQAMLDREDLIKAVKTASLFSKSGLFDVVFGFDPVTKQASLAAVDATRGENTTACGADITGKPNSVTLNYRYLLDGLNSMSSERVVFKMIDVGNPCVVIPDGLDNHLYLIMPIRQ
ncbi:DNA polymerase III subunit beta [Candidatus Uhrbacteria bacterium RIFOXYC12_FULL_57_11]|nr:MAG: DNA polymerase III subunit beta [Candidatus Uhrbacteria bacterium RIFOXYC12_FULL_57_11]